MRILVCVKQVPDTNEVQTHDFQTFERSYAAQIMNPADESALEAALQLRDAFGGSVSLLTMGRPRTETMLREAISRGADNAMQMTDPAFAGADTITTAQCLRACIERTGPYDLIMCGRRTSDGETGQVGPMLAALLDLPCVTNAVRINADPNHISVYQLTERGTVIWRADLPVLITFCEWSYRLRLPTLRGLRRAQTAEIRRMKPEDIGISREACGVRASPTRVEHVEANSDGMRSCARICAEDLLTILRKRSAL